MDAEEEIKDPEVKSDDDENYHDDIHEFSSSKPQQLVQVQPAITPISNNDNSTILRLPHASKTTTITRPPIMGGVQQFCSQRSPIKLYGGKLGLNPSTKLMSLSPSIGLRSTSSTVKTGEFTYTSPVLATRQVVGTNGRSGNSTRNQSSGTSGLRERPGR